MQADQPLTYVAEKVFLALVLRVEGADYIQRFSTEFFTVQTRSFLGFSGGSEPPGTLCVQ